MNEKHLRPYPPTVVENRLKHASGPVQERIKVSLFTPVFPKAQLNPFTVETLISAIYTIVSFNLNNPKPTAHMARQDMQLCSHIPVYHDLARNCNYSLNHRKSVSNVFLGVG